MNLNLGVFMNKEADKYFPFHHWWHTFQHQTAWTEVDNSKWCQTNQALRKQPQCCLQTSTKVKLGNEEAPGSPEGHGDGRTAQA